MYNFFKDFFSRLNTGEKLASITSTLVTWFWGVFLIDIPIMAFFIKGIMWLGALAVSAIIPKIVTSFYDHRVKDKLEKYLKHKKNNRKDEKRAA